MPTVSFEGQKVHRRPYLKAAFAASGRWTVVNDWKKAERSVVIGMAGIAGYFPGANVKRYPGLICGDTNPWGINAFNEYAQTDCVIVYLTSFNPKHNRGRIVREGDGDGQDPHRFWRSQAVRYGLPTPAGWSRKRTGFVVVILPKAGGWKFPSVNTWIDFHARVVRRVCANCGDDILIRPHPKNMQNPDPVAGLMKRLVGVADRVRLDTSRISDLAQKTKAVVCSWGTASIRFIIYGGVPVLNCGGEDNVADPVSFRGYENLRDLESVTLPVPPVDFLETLARRVFSRREFENGDFVRYIEDNAGDLEC